MAPEAAPASPLQSSARAYVAGAQRRERSARHLARRREWVGALRLYADATVLLLRAQLAAAGDGSGLGERPPAQLLEGVLERGRRERWVIPAELERLRGCFSGGLEWDAFDDLDELAAQRASDDFDAALRFLRGQLPELREAERRRELRWIAAGATLLGLSVLGALLWWLLQPPNLASRRPVTAAPAGFATEAEEAVNGVRFGEIGYHSMGSSPWLVVDLEQTRSVRRVEIYGRGDCCFDQSIPLTVEGSVNGSAYEVLGRFNEPFRPFRPSVLRMKPTSVRYLRLRSPRNSSLVVAEVEVY